MSRNKTFQPDREPLRNTETLQLNGDKIHGPFSFLNPTQARFNAVHPEKSGTDSQASDDVEKPGQQTTSGEIPATSVAYKWTSRNNRKGRHALIVQPADTDNAQYSTPALTNGAKQVLKGIWRMFTYFPVWDISYLIAVVFTWGSVIWVINAFFAFLPFTNPKSEFRGEILFGGGITAFIGATVFEFGSVLLMLEAVNENRVGCFGWALEKLYDEHLRHDGAESSAVTRIIPSKDDCTHHHQNTGNFVGKPTKAALTNLSNKSIATIPADPTPEGNKSWVWIPSWNELTTHYLHDLGFLACSSQMFGATVFWVSGFTALPQIFEALNTPAKLNGAFWAPQVIGGAGFVVSGTLFMIETQKHWWQPAPGVLGWHVGLWNLIGGIGFTLCPMFGLLGAKHWAEYQAGCSTFWGSWAFLIGSAIQWYESLGKHPVGKGKED